MNRLSVNFCGIEFKNPVIPASGTFGYGREYDKIYPIEKLGGISVKGTTEEERTGNLPPRIAETYGGMLNSVGLQNPGIDHFIEYELPFLKSKGIVVIANMAGKTVDGYREVAEKLDKTNADIIEVNISCPNVKAGGAAFGVSCEGAAAVTKAVRSVTTKPIMVKLSPNVTNIAEIAKAVESEGADAISLINTLLGMRIDIKTKRPILRNNVGGLSGRGIFPVAVRMVWQVSNAVSIPVCGMGGIYTYEDAVEMMMAGAKIVQVGAAIFDDPFAPLKIIDGLNDYAERENIKNIGEISGSVIPW